MKKIKVKSAQTAADFAQTREALATLDGIKALLGDRFEEARSAIERLGAVDAWGRNAALGAADAGDAKSLAAAIAHGISPLGKGLDDLGALELAARAGSLDCVRLLLAAGLDPVADENGMGAFEYAAKPKTLDILAELIKARPVLARERSANVVAIAIHAGSQQMFDLIEPLIHYGAWCSLAPTRKKSLVGESMPGCGPVACAAIAGRLDLLDRMAAAGADLDLPCQDGSSAMEMCAALGLGASVARLLALGASFGTAWVTQAPNMAGLMRVVKKPSMGPVATGSLAIGQRMPSAMELAARAGHFEIADALCALGANPLLACLPDDGGRARPAPAATMTWALGKAKPGMANDMSEGASPLLRSLSGGSAELVKALLDAGGDPRVKGADGLNAIESCEAMLAMYKGAGLGFGLAHPWVKRVKEELSALRDGVKALESAERAGKRAKPGR